MFQHISAGTRGSAYRSIWFISFWLYRLGRIYRRRLAAHSKNRVLQKSAAMVAHKMPTAPVLKPMRNNTLNATVVKLVRMPSMATSRSSSLARTNWAQSRRRLLTSSIT